MHREAKAWWVQAWRSAAASYSRPPPLRCRRLPPLHATCPWAPGETAGAQRCCCCTALRRSSLHACIAVPIRPLLCPGPPCVRRVPNTAGSDGCFNEQVRAPARRSCPAGAAAPALAVKAGSFPTPADAPSTTLHAHTCSGPWPSSTAGAPLLLAFLSYTCCLLLGLDFMLLPLMRFVAALDVWDGECPLLLAGLWLPAL